jgi:hypothetical protein
LCNPINFPSILNVDNVLKPLKELGLVGAGDSLQPRHAERSLMIQPSELRLFDGDWLLPVLRKLVHVIESSCLSMSIRSIEWVSMGIGRPSRPGAGIEMLIT